MIAKSRNLHLEDYELFLQNPHSLLLFYPQLEQIAQMHGFAIRNEKRRKGDVVEALSGIDHLMKPQRSTLNETLSSVSCCLTVDEVNVDLFALQWQQEHPVLSTQSLSSSNNNRLDFDDNGGTQRERIGAKRRKMRREKEKERKVFEPVHLTKPRSMKSRQKRKRLSQIGNSFCLG